MCWQVEGVHFSAEKEVGEEVVFLNVLCWTNFPLNAAVFLLRLAL